MKNIARVKKMGGKVLLMGTCWKAFVFKNGRKFMAYGVDDKTAASNLLAELY